MSISTKNELIEIIVNNQFALAFLENERYNGEITSDLVNESIEFFLSLVSDYETDFVKRANYISVGTYNENLVINFSNTNNFGTILRVEFINGKYNSFTWI